MGVIAISANAEEHHYTFDFGEVKNLHSLGWQYEGVGWKVIE